MLVRNEAKYILTSCFKTYAIQIQIVFYMSKFLSLLCCNND